MPPVDGVGKNRTTVGRLHGGLCAATTLAVAVTAWLCAATAPSAKAMVIVEPRQHPDLCKVLLNFHERVPPDWDLYVFHGASHAAHARACTRAIRRRRRVVLHALHKDDFAVKEHDALFKSEELLWSRVHAEHVLVMQTDSVACGAFPGSADDFVGLAPYMGCPVDHRVGLSAYMGLDTAFYGIGGLSFVKDSAAHVFFFSEPRAI
jgi:hypothetical protein